MTLCSLASHLELAELVGRTLTTSNSLTALFLLKAPRCSVCLEVSGAKSFLAGLTFLSFPLGVSCQGERWGGGGGGGEWGGGDGGGQKSLLAINTVQAPYVVRIYVLLEDLVPTLASSLYSVSI